MKYYAAYGTYTARFGTYIVVARSLADAHSKLDQMVQKKLPVSIKYNTLVRVWEGEQLYIEDIEQKKVDYYTRLTNDVYFFEE